MRALHILSDASWPHMFTSVRNRQICMYVLLVGFSFSSENHRKSFHYCGKICGSTIWKRLGVTSDVPLHLSEVDLRGPIVLHWFMVFHIFHIWMPGIFNTLCSAYLTDNCALSPQLFSFLAFFCFSSVKHYLCCETHRERDRLIDTLFIS